MAAERFDILRINTADGPVILAVPDAEVDHKDYWYEEHHCPTNFIRDVRAVIADGSCDPHGLFEYVKTVEVDFETTRPLGERYTTPDKEWRRVLPEAYEAESK